jgi:hypothetical protein
VCESRLKVSNHGFLNLPCRGVFAVVLPGIYRQALRDINSSMRMLHTCRSSLFLAASLATLGACSGGGGGGGATAPQIAASVPNGAGTVAIVMAGTWQIQNATVIDSNSTQPVPPLNGTTFVIEPGRVVSIGGLPVDAAGLQVLLGAPLDSYVNQVDDRTVFYGLIVDRRSAMQSREEVAVAGGALDADTISVEAYTSTQAPSAAEPIFTLSRYQLVRVAPTTPLHLLPEGAEPAVEDVLHAAFGRD